MITAALVDDHQLFRKSVTLLLNTFENISVVYDTDNGRHLLEYLEEHPVQIVLLDLQMPIMNGYELCKLLKSHHPEIKILIVSQLTSKEAIHKVMELGANGFLTKNSPSEQLETAVISIMKKDYYFDLELSAVIREAILWENKISQKIYPIEPVSFTQRELEVIRLSCKDKSCKEIAADLFLSTRTIEKHRNRIMERIDSKNFISVILYAIKYRFISIDEL